VVVKNLSRGVTNSRRAALEKDGRNDAPFRTVRERKASFQGAQSSELNVNDAYTFNVAGHELGQSLELKMDPVSVLIANTGRNRVSHQNGN
jgi:uncharacterized alpha-E superfamily protein